MTHIQPDSPLSLGLAIAILGRVSTSDLVHAICSPHVSLDEATNVIYHTLDLLDTHYKSDIPYPSTWDVVGIATEVYRSVWCSLSLAVIL